jgi:hypothetical protein
MKVSHGRWRFHRLLCDLTPLTRITKELLKSQTPQEYWDHIKGVVRAYAHHDMTHDYWMRHFGPLSHFARNQFWSDMTNAQILGDEDILQKQKAYSICMKNAKILRGHFSGASIQTWTPPKPNTKPKPTTKRKPRAKRQGRGGETAAAARPAAAPSASADVPADAPTAARAAVAAAEVAPAAVEVAPAAAEAQQAEVAAAAPAGAVAGVEAQPEAPPAARPAEVAAAAPAGAVAGVEAQPEAPPAAPSAAAPAAAAEAEEAEAAAAAPAAEVVPAAADAEPQAAAAAAAAAGGDASDEFLTAHPLAPGHVFPWFREWFDIFCELTNSWCASEITNIVISLTS